MNEQEVELVKWLADHKDFVHNKDIILGLIQKEQIPEEPPQTVIEHDSGVQNLVLIGILIIMFFMVLKG